MGSRRKGFNETTFGIAPLPASSIPHYKKQMPPDQKSKLLAMHRAGRVNAGIYVAIVLGIYLILLTILLCRHSRKHRSSEEGRVCCGLDDDPEGPFGWLIKLTSCCNHGSPPKRQEIPTHAIEDIHHNEPETIELIDKVSRIPDSTAHDEDEIEPVEV